MNSIGAPILLNDDRRMDPSRPGSEREDMSFRTFVAIDVLCFQNRGLSGSTHLFFFYLCCHVHIVLLFGATISLYILLMVVLAVVCLCQEGFNMAIPFAFAVCVK